MDAYDFFVAAKTDPVTSSIPFIYLTAYSEKKDIEKAFGMGAQDYIIKQFDADELIGVVKKHLKDPLQIQ